MRDSDCRFVSRVEGWRARFRFASVRFSLPLTHSPVHPRTHAHTHTHSHTHSHTLSNRTDFKGLDEWINGIATLEEDVCKDTDEILPNPPPPPRHVDGELSRTGVDILLSMLDSKTLPSVSDSDMPSLITSCSSCQLLGNPPPPDPSSPTESGLNDKCNDSCSSSQINDNTASDLVNLSMNENFADNFDDGTNTITSSDSYSHYSLSKPYEAPILSATYLTKSDTSVAKTAATAMLNSKSPWSAVSVMEKTLPITPSNETTAKEAQCNQKR